MASIAGSQIKAPFVAHTIGSRGYVFVTTGDPGGIILVNYAEIDFVCEAGDLQSLPSRPRFVS